MPVSDSQRARDAYLDVWRDGRYSQLPWLARILDNNQMTFNGFFAPVDGDLMRPKLASASCKAHMSEWAAATGQTLL